MSQYKVVKEDGSHHFKLGDIVTRLPDEDNAYQRVKLLAKIFGCEAEMINSDSHAYVDAEQVVQVLKGDEVEALV